MVVWSISEEDSKFGLWEEAWKVIEELENGFHLGDLTLQLSEVLGTVQVLCWYTFFIPFIVKKIPHALSVQVEEDLQVLFGFLFLLGLFYLCYTTVAVADFNSLSPVAASLR